MIVRLTSFAALIVLSLAVAGYAIAVYGFLPLGAAVHADMRATFETRPSSQYEGITMALVANRYWILLALFAAATVSYSLGFMAGFGLFIAVGVVFELAFWHQLIKRIRRR
jgi:uncharacterized membrane protein YccF (DUF307 family)